MLTGTGRVATHIFFRKGRLFNKTTTSWEADHLHIIYTAAKMNGMLSACFCWNTNLFYGKENWVHNRRGKRNV